MIHFKKINIIAGVLVVILSIFIKPSVLFAQDVTLIDSLGQVYEQEQNDSLKTRLLIDLIRAYDLNNIDTAIYLAKVAEERAIATTDTLSLAEIKGILARYSSIRSQYPTALKYDFEALSLYKSIGHERGELGTLNDIGEDYFDQDLFNDAYVYYQKSLNKAQEVNDELSIAIATYNIGRVLKSMGQIEQSMVYVHDALEISDKIGDREGVAYALHDLGEILYLEKDYKNALNGFKQALLYCDSLSLEELRPQILNNMANVYRQQNDVDKSLTYHDSALDIYEKQSNKRGIGEVFLGKGLGYLAIKEYQRAKEYFGKSLSVSQDIRDSELMIKNYKYLSQLYESQGDLTLALAFFKKYKSAQDSLFSEKKNEQFAQTQMEYEVAKKDIEIELLSQDQVKRDAQLKNEELIRNIFVVILALTAVLIANLYRNSIRRKKINARLIEKQEELTKQRKELQSLLTMKDKFFSIISHDLRSPINGLVGIIDFMQEGHITQDELKEVTKSLKIRLNSTKKMLDSLLDWAMVQMNDINPEYDEVDIKRLIEENFTFFSEVNEKNINFKHQLNGGIDVWADQNMLDLVIRNLVSNAIKFTEQNGEITINAEESADKVTVEVRDNGIGMSQEQVANLFDTKLLYTTKGTANEKGTGLGLRLCKEFIEKMEGEIWVDSKEGEGSIFKFTIGKKKEESII